MGEITGIAWTDHTFNAWIGCQAVSPACDRCYAQATVERWGGDFSARRRTAPANWQKPLAWNRKAAKDCARRRVFCSSLADVFDNQVPEQWRADLFGLITATPNLDWLLLTKRPQNIAKMLPLTWGDGWPNVWLGTTAENQLEMDRRAPHLQAVPAAVRFYSVEPMLEEIAANLRGISWVICGGESGPGARAMRPEWALDLLADAAFNGAAFFFKQVGSNHTGWPGKITGKGHDPAEWPSALRVQEWPVAEARKAFHA